MNYTLKNRGKRGRERERMNQFPITNPEKKEKRGEEMIFFQLQSLTREDREERKR